LFAPGGKFGKEVLSSPASDIRYVLTARFHDLEIGVVNPDSSLEIALTLFDFFRRYVKDVGVEFVFLLLPYIENVVLRNFIGGEHERQTMLNIVHVFFRHGNALEGRLWGKNNLLGAF